MAGDIITLTSRTDRAGFGAFQVQPDGPRRGGLIVLQEIFGVDGHIRSDSERWGAMGFEVLAPSLFDRRDRGFVAPHTMEGMHVGLAHMQATRIEDALGDIDACAEALRPRGPVFVVGYCYGGSLAYLAACRLTGLAAVSSYYGAMVPKFADETPRCPVICHFGRQDSNIPLEGVEAFAARRTEVPVHLYDAGHGFNNDGGGGFDAAASELARRRTQDLFTAHGAG